MGRFFRFFCGMAVVVLIWGATNFSGISGCGTSEEAAEEEAEGVTSAENVGGDVSGTITMISTAVNEMLTDNVGALVIAGTANTTVTPDSVDCPLGGTVDFTGTLDEPNAGDFDLSLTLTACEGAAGALTGTLNAEGTYVETAEDAFTVTVTVTGTINGEACNTTLTTLSFDDVDLAGTSISGGTMTGSASATCGSDTVTCSWSGVDLTDTNAIEAGCS